MAESKRVLVTGATGFVGRHALAPLRRLGFEVHALSSKPVNEATSAEAGKTVAAETGDAVWHRANLFDAGQTRAVLESVRPTHLLHFAWYAEHGKFWNSPINLEWLSATLSLLKAFAETGGKRFVGAGSCVEYGGPERDAYVETDPLQPNNVYGAAKASAFLTGAAYAQAAKIDFAWGRIFYLFGPGEAPVRIIPALIRAHLNGEKLDCSGGTQLRDFLPAASVADAFVHLCDSALQGAVNIASGETVTLREVSERIAEKIGRRGDIRFGALPDSGPAKLLPSMQRLFQELGWLPPLSVDSGLTEAIEWWRAREGLHGKTPGA